MLDRTRSLSPHHPMTHHPTVVAIHITSGSGRPMQAVAEIEAVAGEGLTGDRYRDGTGFYSPIPITPGARELTLIAEEVLAAIAQETSITLLPEEHRRNLTTRGVDLDALIGQRFTIGAVLCEGIRSCPPCRHLEEITGKPVMPPLVHRGGLRARIITNGWLHVGDPVLPFDDA